jgi:hypothetical protein
MKTERKEINNNNNNNKANYISNKSMIIFWLLVISLGTIFGGLNVGVGLTIAAILSIIIWNYTLNSEWEGIIQDIKVEKMYDKADNTNINNYREIKIAYVRLNNGKLKKITSYPNWKKGDKLKKEKKDFRIHKIN